MGASARAEEVSWGLAECFPRAWSRDSMAGKTIPSRLASLGCVQKRMLDLTQYLEFLPNAWSESNDLESSQ